MKYVKGDLLNAEETVIAHGCNCQGVMGSGVALAVKNKYPYAYIQYVKDIKSGRQLGDCSFYMEADDKINKIVLSLLTQEYFGTDRRQVNYAAIVYSLIHALNIADLDYDFEIKTIAIPKIGAGLGGGDWNIIEAILKDFELMCDIEFVVYEL